MALCLTQRETAKRIGVTECSVYNWESGVSPSVQTVPRIIAFLEYAPYYAYHSLGEQLRYARICNGLSRDEMAGRLKLDPSTIKSVEQGNLGAIGKYACSLKRELVSAAARF